MFVVFFMCRGVRYLAHLDPLCFLLTGLLTGPVTKHSSQKAEQHDGMLARRPASRDAGKL